MQRIPINILFARIPESVLNSSLIFLELIKLKNCIHTNKLKIIVKCRDG